MTQIDGPLPGDARVLTPSVTARELRDFRRDAGIAWHRSVGVVSTAVALVVAAITAGAIILHRYLEEQHVLVSFFQFAVPLAWIVLICGGYIWWLRWRLRDVRLWRFARMNGLGYWDAAESGTGGYHRVRDGVGFPPTMRNVERATFGRPGVAVVGRNQVSPKPGSRRIDVRRPFAFAELSLPSAVPHIVLRSRKSRVLALVGLGVGNRVRLGLEGDFDRHFTLLCPSGYEHDALRIFTPDLMAVLIDYAKSTEVELVDDKMFVYFQHGTPLWRSEAMQRLQRTLMMLHEKATNRTERYRDDRAAFPEQSAGGRIALAGRRTTSRDGASVTTIVAFVGVVVVSAAVLALTWFVFPAG